MARPVARSSPAAALPAWIPPQLTQLVDAAPEGDQWLHEIKFDGYRMHARLDRGTVKLLTRTGLDWTHKYPPIAAAVASLGARQAYLDGELCGVFPDGITQRWTPHSTVSGLPASCPIRRSGIWRQAYCRLFSSNTNPRPHPFTSCIRKAGTSRPRSACFSTTSLKRCAPNSGENNRIAAPHVAGLTREAVDRMGVAAVENILSVLDGKPIRDNVVNNEVLD